MQTPSHMKVGQGWGTGPTSGVNVAAQVPVARHGGKVGRPVQHRWSVAQRRL